MRSGRIAGTIEAAAASEEAVLALAMSSRGRNGAEEQSADGKS